ncbi:MAG: hypothetical protein Q8M65_11895 [Rhodoglobus sp.]|nr:hypothetical protein [Rhodoglobus sp.]
MSFLDDLNAATQIERPTADVDVLLNKSRYALRFTQMTGIDWGLLVDKHPPRIGTLGKTEGDKVDPVYVDLKYGYNVRAVVLEAAPLCGEVVGEGAISAAKWQQLLKALDGAAFQRVCDAIFNLNEIAPEKAVDAARKGPKPSRRSSSSPSNSE